MPELWDHRQPPGGRYRGGAGVQPHGGLPYVTWKCYAYDNFQGYNYGRYFGDEQAARKNMKQRVDELREELPPGHPDWKPRRHRKDPGMER